MRVVASLTRGQGRGIFRFDATCEDAGRKDFCGHITVEKAGTRQRPHWKVANVAVEQDYQRRGVATRLYEVAAREACRRGGPLVSTSRGIGSYSNSFWEKQIKKGRATRRETATQDFFSLSCPPPSTLAGRRR